MAERTIAFIKQTGFHPCTLGYPKECTESHLRDPTSQSGEQRGAENTPNTLRAPLHRALPSCWKVCCGQSEPLDQRSGRRQSLPPAEAHVILVKPTTTTADRGTTTADHGTTAVPPSNLVSEGRPAFSQGASRRAEQFRKEEQWLCPQGTCLRLDQHCHPNFVGLGGREVRKHPKNWGSLLHT